MNTYKRIMQSGFLLVVLLAVFVLVSQVYMQNTTPRRYTYDPAGILFEYPATYRIEERAYDKGMLVKIKPRRISTTASVNLASATEVDPEITCDMQKTDQQLDLLDWINHTISPARLIKDTVYPSVDVSGVEAFGFKTDGLYVADNIVFQHKKYITHCSVEYITLDDPLRMDFVFILSHLKTF